MTKVLLGVRGLSDEASSHRVLSSLRAVPGVLEAGHPETISGSAEPDRGQVEVGYDPARATVMDLIRAVRSAGFLAGML
ncbi:MAG TPA: heavy-metal-associated domain-containing protein [Deinococcales bacterium]|nr:heavy-metal-associated domain-containing protein [Deinococcales bacterium]